MIQLLDAVAVLAGCMVVGIICWGLGVAIWQKLRRRGE